jgi:hypothetical protein
MAFVPSSDGLAWNLRRHRRSGLGPARLLSFERPHGRPPGGLMRFSRTAGIVPARTLKTPERFVVFSIESSEQGHTVDALAPGADEGRGRLR